MTSTAQCPKQTCAMLVVVEDGNITPLFELAFNFKTFGRWAA
jgi:hypothetical protein